MCKYCNKVNHNGPYIDICFNCWWKTVKIGPNYIKYAIGSTDETQNSNLVD